MRGNNDRLHPLWKHAVITFCLCLALFPILPLIYLSGLACYYGGGFAWKNKDRAGKAAAGWIPWKLVAVGFLSLLTGSIIFTARYGPQRGDQMTSEERGQEITTYAAMSLPLWLLAFYLPAVLRWKSAKRSAQQAEVLRAQSDERHRLTDLRATAVQMSKDIEKGLIALEATRREMFRVYVSHKPFLDEREWQESLFTDFEGYKRDIQSGRIAQVTLTLRALHASLERAGMIGRLRADYKKRRPVIGKDISEQAFESLLRGIPETGDFRSAGDDVQVILVQAYGDRAPAWIESESERHLDSLLDAMDSVEELEVEAPDKVDIVPLKKRSS